MIRRWALLAVFYAAATAVMVRPCIDYRELDKASYTGDARLIIWTLAWNNHAVLNRAPLFDSNIFYPTPHSLAYNEHLFGLGLFTLPIYATTHNPILAYNVVWLLSFVLNGLAAHALLMRLTGRDLAAAVGQPRLHLLVLQDAARARASATHLDLDDPALPGVPRAMA